MKTIMHNLHWFMFFIGCLIWVFTKTTFVELGMFYMIAAIYMKVAQND